MSASLSVQQAGHFQVMQTPAAEPRSGTVVTGDCRLSPGQRTLLRSLQSSLGSRACVVAVELGPQAAGAAESEVNERQ